MTRPKVVKSTKSKSQYRSLQPFTTICQFKIAIKETNPPVWRRIQVPGGYSFWDLHCAITDSLGWLDHHNHMFNVWNPKTRMVEKIGAPSDERGGIGVLAGWELKIADYFSLKYSECDYLYDFGDSWYHSVVLESILPGETGVAYPRCIGGEKACPPEDVGGVTGYERFKKAVSYANAKDHDEMLAWAGGWFDPDWFDFTLIRFEDPHIRWKIAFQEEPIPRSMRLLQYHQMNPAHQNGKG